MFTCVKNLMEPQKKLKVQKIKRDIFSSIHEYKQAVSSKS